MLQTSPSSTPRRARPASSGRTESDESLDLRERWRPQPAKNPNEPSPQIEAIQAVWCQELLYGGAAGGGKSDYLLGDFLQDVPTYGKAWRGILFRRTYSELEELMARAQELYPQTGAKWNEAKTMWTWPNGAVLRFRHLERQQDKTRYLGASYTWIGWDELTQWATDVAYRYLRGRLRSKHDVPTKRIRATANPGGTGHQWVKSYFVMPAREGYHPVYDPVTKHTRMFVPAKLSQNLILLKNDPDYASRLAGLGSETLVKAMLDGDWDVIEGAFFDCWSHARHVLTPFTIPEGWLRFRSGDWGSAAPFSFGWWAVVQDDFRHDGRTLPRGSLVRYREWYGTKNPAEDAQKGLKMDATEVGRRMAIMEGDEKLAYAVLDPRCFAKDSGPTAPSIAEMLNDELTRKGCVAFHKADNQRVARAGLNRDGTGPLNGWDQMRMRLVGKLDESGKPRGIPMMYFFSTCVASIRTIPVLQHDASKPEDLDTHSEDHCADDARYACSSRPWVRKIIPKEPDAPAWAAVEGEAVNDSFLTM